MEDSKAMSQRNQNFTILVYLLSSKDNVPVMFNG